MDNLQIKRAYEPCEDSDGFRIYIDRLWPRGLSHSTFIYDWWDKEIAPSSELREWFHADPSIRWVEFEQKYAEELKKNPAFATLRDTLADKGHVTLLYSSKDPLHNNAIVVKKLLEGIV